MSAQNIPTALDFDSLIHLENMFIEFGHEDGIREGLRSGKIEGKVLGCEKGFELSREVGFYEGCAEMWLRLAVLAPGSVGEKAIKQLQALQTLISTFPSENQLSTEILVLLERIRAKVKVVSSLLGVPIKYNAVEKPAMNY